MPSALGGPSASQRKVNELRNAVSRWDYEGGAGVTGPQEGYEIGSHSGEIPSGQVRQHPGIPRVDEMHLYQLVRLLFAVSAIHSEPLSPEPQGTKGTLSLISFRRNTVVPDRISDVLTRMIRAPGAGTTRTDHP